MKKITVCKNDATVIFNNESLFSKTFGSFRSAIAKRYFLCRNFSLLSFFDFAFENIGIVFKKQEEENELKRNDLNKSGSAVLLFKQNVQNVCCDERKNENCEHRKPERKISLAVLALEDAEEKDGDHDKNEKRNRSNRVNKVKAVAAASCWGGHTQQERERTANCQNIRQNVFIPAFFERKNEVKAQPNADENACYCKADRIVKSGHADCVMNRISDKGEERE